MTDKSGVLHVRVGNDWPTFEHGLGSRPTALGLYGSNRLVRSTRSSGPVRTDGFAETYVVSAAHRRCSASRHAMFSSSNQRHACGERRAAVPLLTRRLPNPSGADTA